MNGRAVWMPTQCCANGLSVSLNNGMLLRIGMKQISLCRSVSSNFFAFDGGRRAVCWKLLKTRPPGMRTFSWTDLRR